MICRNVVANATERRAEPSTFALRIALCCFSSLSPLHPPNNGLSLYPGGVAGSFSALTARPPCSRRRMNTVGPPSRARCESLPGPPQLGLVAAPEPHTAKSTQSHHFSSQHGSRNGASLSGRSTRFILLAAAHQRPQTLRSTPCPHQRFLRCPRWLKSAICPFDTNDVNVDRALIEGLDANAPPMDGTGQAFLPHHSCISDTELQARCSNCSSLRSCSRGSTVMLRWQSKRSSKLRSHRRLPAELPTLVSPEPPYSIPMVAITFASKHVGGASNATHPTKAKLRVRRYAIAI